MDRYTHTRTACVRAHGGGVTAWPIFLLRALAPGIPG